MNPRRELRLAVASRGRVRFRGRGERGAGFVYYAKSPINRRFDGGSGLEGGEEFGQRPQADGFDPFGQGIAGRAGIDDEAARCVKSSLHFIHNMENLQGPQAAQIAFHSRGAEERAVVVGIVHNRQRKVFDQPNYRSCIAGASQIGKRLNYALHLG